MTLQVETDGATVATDPAAAAAPAGASGPVAPSVASEPDASSRETALARRRDRERLAREKAREDREKRKAARERKAAEKVAAATDAPAGPGADDAPSGDDAAPVEAVAPDRVAAFLRGLWALAHFALGFFGWGLRDLTSAEAATHGRAWTGVVNTYPFVARVVTWGAAPVELALLVRAKLYRVPGPVTASPPTRPPGDTPSNTADAA